MLWHSAFFTVQLSHPYVTTGKTISSVQLSRSVTFDSLRPHGLACQASLSITNSQNLLKLIPINLVMPSNHLILCCPLLLPPIFPSVRVFSNESVLCIRWPKYWSFSSSVSPSYGYSGLISFGLTGLISLQSKGFSRVFSNSTVQKHQFFSTQSSIWSNFTSIYDYRKKHSFDYMDFHWQSNVSAFYCGFSI